MWYILYLTTYFRKITNSTTVYFLVLKKKKITPTNENSYWKKTEMEGGNHVPPQNGFLFGDFKVPNDCIRFADIKKPFFFFSDHSNSSGKRWFPDCQFAILFFRENSPDLWYMKKKYLFKTIQNVSEEKKTVLCGSRNSFVVLSK